MYEQGEILIVPFPFSDLSSIRQRPVLVLSKKEDNLNSEDIITCGITSNLKDSKYGILIENENLQKGVIPKRSRIKVNKLFTINKSIIIKSLARINLQTWQEVKKEFIRLV
ncbi:MAG: type II toxin-antitoxin system PemK/MazF family toxin [Nanoarchaeota archaeon]